MKTQKMLKLSLVGLTCSALSSQAVFAGHESSGGADDYHPVPAWFTGTDPDKIIRTCYVAAPEFQMVSSLEDMIQEAFKTWGDYIRDKKIDKMLSRSSYIATKLDLRSKCRGDEDLKFYFGVIDDLVTAGLKHYDRPYGFAEKIEPLNVNGPGPAPTPAPVNPLQGIVYIAGNGAANFNLPNWNWKSAPALRALLLHEVGHVLGNGHVDGTVMTEKIGMYLNQDTRGDNPPAPESLAQYASIDAQVELVRCALCRMTYVASQRFELIDDPVGLTDWEYAYKTLMLKSPTGPFSIHYETDGNSLEGGALIVADETGIHRFVVTTTGYIDGYQDSTPLFLGLGADSLGLHMSGAAYLAEIKLDDPTHPGAMLQVAVSYNMDQARVRIVPQLGLGFYERPIFVSKSGSPLAR